MTRKPKKIKQFTKPQEPVKPERKQVKAKTDGQQRLIDTISYNDITIVVGLAGSGKTHISVGMAVKYLLESKVEKIVISRPIIGAGEDPGALPGGIADKLYPYLIPLYDEFKYYVSHSDIATWKNSGTLEIVPLAFARGRTFKNTFVILDEAQNATYAQIKMLVTRLGEGSKILINGDVNQTDLNQKQAGGLSTIIDILDGLHGVKVCYFDKSDIVRHHLLKDVMERFEAHEQKQKKN